MPSDGLTVTYWCMPGHCVHATLVDRVYHLAEPLSSNPSRLRLGPAAYIKHTHEATT